MLSITALLLGILSCDEEDKKININGSDAPAAPTNQITDITFCTAEITGKLELTKEQLEQSEFGFLLSTSEDVTILNNTKHPIKQFTDNYEYTVSLNHLDSLTTYYYRNYIYYKGEYIYSDIKSFTTKAPKDVIITGPLNSDSCTIVSKIDSKNLKNYIRLYGICYGNKPSPTPVSVYDQEVSLDSIDENNTFTTRLCNIPFDTLVYYRAYILIDNDYFYGQEYSFHGNSTETGIIDLTDYSIISKIRILDDGYKKYGLCYGTERELYLPQPGTKVVWTDSINESKQFKLQIVDVPFDTIVYYRSVVMSEGKYNYGNIRSFSGNAINTGIIDTLTLQVKSTIKIADGVTQFGVCYSNTEIPTIDDKKVYTNEISSDNSFTLTLKNIPYGTVYYRSYVIRNGLVAYGDIYHFEGNKITTGDFTPTTATVKSHIKYANCYDTLRVGLCYSTNSNPTINDNKVVTETVNTDNIFEVEIQRIPFEKVYFRAFIMIDGAPEYGEINSFEGNAISMSDIESHNVVTHIKYVNGYDNIKYGICYALYNDPSIEDRCAMTDRVDSQNNYTVKINNDILWGLEDDVNWLYGTIYYRAFVTINDETFYSEIKTYEEPMPVGEEIDLGLSVNWATFNVGADQEKEPGYYYAWGETSPKRSYSWRNYKYWISGGNMDSSNVVFSKYVLRPANGNVDGLKILEANDDVAHVKWGGNWRIPTIIEIQELINNCNWQRIDNGNQKGYLITSKVEGYTDKSIFLPLTNLIPKVVYGDDYLYFTGSSSLSEENPLYGRSLYINDDGIMMDMGIFAGSSARYFGQTIRPVSKSSNWVGITTISLNEDNLDMRIGESYSDFEVTIKSGINDYSFFPVTWSSDKPNVVTVFDNGRIQALSGGTAVISVTCMGKTASCNVTVKPYVPVTDYVDLGLSVKWATCNIGAEKPEEYGFYYSWGETEAKMDYSLSYYKWYDNNTGFTKYSNSNRWRMDGTKYDGFVDDKVTLDLEDDVAYTTLGEGWRMPTITEMTELVENCTWEWKKINDVWGYEVKSQSNSNSIFLPAAGWYESVVYYDVFFGEYNGRYWTSSLETSAPSPTPSMANLLYFSSGEYSATGSSYGRFYGFSIRPVHP